MASTTYIEQAESRHSRLISALSEFKASGGYTDATAGAFGLVIVYDFALDSGIVVVKATIFHSDGAWIRTTVPCPGLGIDQLDQARAVAQRAIMGGGQ